MKKKPTDNVDNNQTGHNSKNTRRFYTQLHENPTKNTVKTAEASYWVEKERDGDYTNRH